MLLLSGFWAPHRPGVRLVLLGNSPPCDLGQQRGDPTERDRPSEEPVTPKPGPVSGQCASLISHYPSCPLCLMTCHLGPLLLSLRLQLRLAHFLLPPHPPPPPPLGQNSGCHHTGHWSLITSTAVPPNQLCPLGPEEAGPGLWREEDPAALVPEGRHPALQHRDSPEGLLGSSPSP